MKRPTAHVLAAVLIVFLLTGCSSGPKQDVLTAERVKSEKIRVVATLFPQYDFTKQIAGDKAEVTLLLPPGVESHSYEPTPSDIIKIIQSDLFIYTGKDMEAWSGKIIDGMKDSGSGCYVLDVSRGIDLIRSEEDDPEHVYDPHIWTDPLIAKEMVAAIRDALCRIDPANEAYYEENASKYSGELDSLDSEFRAIVGGGKRNEIIFGSRFALYYFTKQYGLHYKAAFDSCSSETEPSARTIAGLVKEIKEKRIPVIYYAELEDPKAAKAMSAETGARLLLFHSCHNVTREEMESGETYLSLMEQNAENLKEGLE